MQGLYGMLATALVLALSAGSLASAQVNGTQMASNSARPVGTQAQMAALDAHTYALEVLDAVAMSASDRALLQQREEDVSRAAAFYGLDISDSHWTYQQIVCNTLPDHLMLSFQNDSAEHGASHFVAVVPPNGGKVQVVTDYTHGLLPFHAAWEKSAAYETFNRMTEDDRGEHQLGPESHWLNLSMCFVALTGHLPKVAEPVSDVEASEALVKRNGSTPIILINPGKEAEVHFSDVADARQTGNWQLRFDGRGRLTKAVLDSAGPLKTRTVPISPTIPPIRPE